MIEDPPSSQAEEERRRSQVTIRELIEWYLARSIPLDVPLHNWPPP
jgi:hypothetical protein